MPEYIEREAIKAAVRKRLNNSLIIGWLISIINEVPTANVAPVVHGRWQDYHFVKTDCPRNGFPTVKCSNCEIAFCDLTNNHHFMYHYCPNCGAHMKDGE